MILSPLAFFYCRDLLRWNWEEEKWGRGNRECLHTRFAFEFVINCSAIVTTTFLFETSSYLCSRWETRVEILISQNEKRECWLVVGFPLALGGVIPSIVAMTLSGRVECSTPWWCSWRIADVAFWWKVWSNSRDVTWYRFWFVDE